MKVMVIVKASKESEAGAMPDQEVLTKMNQFNEELVKAGILLGMEGLHPTSKGVRVRFPGGTVIDGPFAETKELGRWFLDLEGQIDRRGGRLDRRSPFQEFPDSEVEIRPVFEAEDFGEAFTPELRAQEARILAEARKNSA